MTGLLLAPCFLPPASPSFGSFSLLECDFLWVAGESLSRPLHGSSLMFITSDSNTFRARFYLLKSELFLWPLWRVWSPDTLKLLGKLDFYLEKYGNGSFSLYEIFLPISQGYRESRGLSRFSFFVWHRLFLQPLRVLLEQ